MSRNLAQLRNWIFTAGAATALLVPTLAQAQLLEITTGPGTRQFYDDLERASAAANQAAYDALLPDCDGLTAPTPTCSNSQLGVFEETRELVETADDLLNPGTNPPNSLGLDNEGLGDALRWTAAEEAQAQSRAATDFSNGQRTSATNRITALRFGATGFSIAGVEGLPTDDFPTVPGQALLGAAGEGETLAKFGGFVNGSYGWGKHDPTTFEDAFDYESVDFTFGFDYRIKPQFVVGLVGGYSESSVDFDASKSIVDGGVNADGGSIGTFAVYSWPDFYVSGFFSYQRMSFDIDRFITYPSNNPNVPGTNTTTSADTDSNAITTALNAGYTYRFGPGSSKMFLLEPSARLEYTHIVIEDYTEDNDGDEEFALRIDEQKVDTVEVSLGLRTSAAISTPIGVFIPYARFEWRFELNDDNRETESVYDGLDGVSVAQSFNLDSEDIDTNFGTITAGIQTIVRGGRTKWLGGAVGDRLSIYGEYRRVLELDDIESELVTGGLRYIF